jgi:predicted ferric reductase
MINAVLVIAGIVIMIVSVVQCIRLINLNSIETLRGAWNFALGLIVFFLLAYIAYFFLETNYSSLPVSSLLISAILFFGAIFVITILSISYTLIKALTIHSSEIDRTNQNLSKNTKDLENKTNELKKIQDFLREKNKELLKTLDDFYTLRLGLQKDIDAGKLSEENRKIKEKLDKLKGNQPG